MALLACGGNGNTKHDAPSAIDAPRDATSGTGCDPSLIGEQCP